MEELQIFERNPADCDLELKVWDEDLSEEQKAVQEAQRKQLEKFNKLRQIVYEKKKTSSCEFWTRKKNKLVGSTPINNVQRIQVGQQQQQQQLITNNSGTYSLVVSSASAPTASNQAYITGRLINSPVTSVSNVYSRPQISAIRSTRPITSVASTIPPSQAPSMSVIHRNSLQQQQQQPVQTAQLRATSVLQPQQIQHLIFDSNSGLLIMPTQQQQQGTTTPQQQQIAIRPNIRQVAPTSTVLNRPTMPTPLGGPRLQNNQQQQGLNQQLQSKTIAPKTTTTRPTTTGSTSTGGFQGRQSTAFRQPVPSSVSNGALYTQNQNLSKSLGKTPSSTTTISTNSSVPSESSGVENTTVMNGKSDSGSTGSNAKTFPSLVVNVKPCLHDKPSKAEMTQARSELDQKVKQILMYAPPKFTEWILQQGLLRMDHVCDLHKTADNQPVKFVLGMFNNDKEKEVSSGGFVWISDCCPGRQVSVWDGSIFDNSQHPPSTLLKLIYHWACQTSASNVLNWCKVSGGYLKNFYTLLRSVCVAALHELCPKMGGPGKFVEVGIITLGTTLSAPTGKKHVKIEILGVFDPASKMIRMKLVNPNNSTNLPEGSKTRGVQILSPVSLWVEKSSTIVIDSSIEQNLLIDMGFKNIVRCQSSPENQEPSTTPTNVNAMKYLRHVVPKMFQATLCVLSKSLIQQFLDELSWREKWGKTSKDTFDNILSHIGVMTKWEFGTERNLVAWLNKVSMNPFQDWSYTRMYTQRSGIDLLPESIRKADMPALQVYNDKSKTNGMSLNNIGNYRSGGSKQEKPPLLLPQVPMLNTNGPVKRKSDSLNGTLNLAEYFIKQPKTLTLESYYYAELPGINKHTGGEFPQLVKCPLCSKPFYSNLDVYRHIFSHVNAIGRVPSPLHFCVYCLKEIQPSAMPAHVLEHHKMTSIEGFACRICTEKFTHESQFVIHMWTNHCEADTPYKCEVCDYQSSFHYQVVDHYNETHKGCDSVMCPICMKVLTARSYICLKQITVHIQTHQMRKGRKCPHCSLVFFGEQEYRAHIQDGAHKERPNLSRKIIYYDSEDKASLTKMAKPPKVNRATLPPINKKMKLSSADGPKKTYPPVSRPITTNVSNMYNITEHNIIMHGATSKLCLECDLAITRSEHFPGHMSCIKCRFSTCCKAAMQAHYSTAHPASGHGKSLSSIKVKDVNLMEKPLLCACGFQSVNPNRLARHLALCEKTTVFPLDWEEQQKKRGSQPPPQPLSILDHLELMRENK